MTRVETRIKNTCNRWHCVIQGGANRCFNSSLATRTPCVSHILKLSYHGYQCGLYKYKHNVLYNTRFFCFCMLIDSSCQYTFYDCTHVNQLTREQRLHLWAKDYFKIFRKRNLLFTALVSIALLRAIIFKRTLPRLMEIVYSLCPPNYNRTFCFVCFVLVSLV